MNSTHGMGRIAEALRVCVYQESVFDTAILLVIGVKKQAGNTRIVLHSTEGRGREVRATRGRAEVELGAPFRGESLESKCVHRSPLTIFV